ncbi:MAG: hypothetical protein ABSB53_05135 [Nitrososphaerales archaeon]
MTRQDQSSFAFTVKLTAPSEEDIATLQEDLKITFPGIYFTRTTPSNAGPQYFCFGNGSRSHDE